ncbi:MULTISPECIES: epoxide hydrolase family protein [unclassified Rathayibacter]|uniref:epoxide hydrolase family protein n=1 Tax=unclassified Rathayibacter TaxID=2609250 RepID=UPI0006F7A1EC|nr:MULTISPECIES: epoxide hydrolase family protein [unclassified Rathayibacter]KQQ03475.1 epoxide hydrolase [Rathayibacter sp. Leaf294]KQS11931.1 epoxide hydrolase [Rathayibacter sp. Leaf185]
MSEAASIHPFRVDIAASAVDDLRARLRSTRLPEPLPGDDWATGVPTGYLRGLVDAWADFDWPGYQEQLNEAPQFTTVIDGQTIHFVHVRSEAPGAVPLLLTHGWPGSYLELLGLIEPLTGAGFDVVIPSLPGFGFSSPLTSGGWTTRRIAETWAELMTRLGYDRFAVQGGDLGAGVAPEVARVAPDRVIGVHVNGTLGFTPEVDDETAASLTPLEQDRLRRIGEFMRNEFGYIAIQSTRPGLVGELLSDSPAAQLAWQIDKFRAWTHPLEAAAEDVVGLEFLLANASLYWFTATAGSAAYVGYAQEAEWGAVPEDSGVPTAVICFAHDIGIRRFVEDAHTIVRWTDVPERGGHFAALEEPELLVADIREFVDGLRG